MITADQDASVGAGFFVGGKMVQRIDLETVPRVGQISCGIKPQNAEMVAVTAAFHQSATFAAAGKLHLAQNLRAQVRGQTHVCHGLVLTWPVSLPVERSMISTSPPDGVATCSTSLPASVVAETMRAPGARVTRAAAPACTAAGACRSTINMWAWRRKPQTVPKSATTSRTVMIMT